MHIVMFDSDEAVRKAVRARLLSADHTFEGFDSSEEMMDYLSATNVPPIDAIVIGKTSTPDLVSYDDKALEKIQPAEPGTEQKIVEQMVVFVRRHERLAKVPIVVHAKATLVESRITAKLGVLSADKFAPYGALMAVLKVT